MHIYIYIYIYVHTRGGLEPDAGATVKGQRASVST